MLIVRPAISSDLDDLFVLAKNVSPGMTTFPPDRDVLSEKIRLAESAFSGEHNQHNYLMVIEDTENQKIVGTSGVYANIGVDTPFYSFAILTRTQRSTQLNLRVKSQTLHLVNAYAGDTEVGTLVLDPSIRGRGAGKLAAKARYMLIAQFRARFGAKVMAELRGWSDENAQSPFWDNVGSHFFTGLSYQQADLLSATTDTQFIADLMPTYPIYIDLLSRQAREVIGQPHEQGRYALKMLKDEGFRYENIIDIFDAGPTLHADIDTLKTVADSAVYTVGAINEPIIGAQHCLACNDKLKDFRCANVLIGFDEKQQLVISQHTAGALMLDVGDTVRILPQEVSQS